ncbi:MAG TPA: hypothetical protein VE547_22610, partial [Mycobacteriales bacterium]|nr:hypothetical protein [Mycobacteriales bacterium]
NRSFSELSGRLSVATPLNSQILDITYRGDTPAEAAAGANAFAEAYLDFRRGSAEEQLRNRLDNLSRRITALTAELRSTPGRLQQELLATDISGLREQQSALTTTVVDPGTVIGVAQRPAWPASPRRLMYFVSGLLVGLLVGLVAAVARDRNDDRLRRPEQLAEAVGAPLLVSSKRLHGLSRLRRRRRPARAEGSDGSLDAGLGRNGYGVLRSKVMSPTTGRGSRRFLIAGPDSPSAFDGTEEVATGLADALTGLGRQVALLPADAYSTRLNLVTRRDPAASWRYPPTIVSPEQAMRIVGQEAGAGNTFDDLWLVVAGAAAGSGAELLTTAATMDAVIVLARQGATSLSDLRQFREDLEQVDAQIMGCLLIDAPRRVSGRPPADRQQPTRPAPTEVGADEFDRDEQPAAVETR